MAQESSVATAEAVRLAENRFQLKNIYDTIICEDALDVLKRWPDDCIDTVITDPPYNIARDRRGLSWAFSSHITISNNWDRFNDSDYERFCASWMEQIRRVTKPNGNIFIFGSYHNIYLIGALAQKLNLRFINSIIWAKPNAQPNITCRMFTESTEQILWLCNNSKKKAKNWTFNYKISKELNEGKQMRNFWLIPLTPKSEKKFGKHPSQKPLKLLERIILTCSRSEDLILDCFAGSGTALVAAKKYKRKYIGIENSQQYCEIARQRLSEL